MLKDGIYFVSGIDTDAGKSFVTGGLAAEFISRGKSAITQKFIQTGGVGESGVSIDIELHRKIMGSGLLPEDLDGTTAPVIFSYPASPHLAAKIDKREIDFEAIKRCTLKLASKYNILLIEGAGGLHVPLKGAYTTIDYIKDCGYPLIFITSGRLGSINHTLLSLEACRNRGIDVAMVVYTRHFDLDKVIAADTVEYLKEYVEREYSNCEFKIVESLELPK